MKSNNPSIQQSSPPGVQTSDSPLPLTGLPTHPPAVPNPPRPAKAPTATEFRLFKRSEDRDAAYYFDFTYKSKRFQRCLQTNDKTEAQRRAKLRYNEITGALQREDYPTLARLKLRRATTSTLADIITAYRAAPVDAGAKSREQNIHALLQVLRVAGHVAEPGALSASLLRPALAQGWFAVASEKSRAAEATGDQARAASLKRSANSRFVQAASLFTPKALASYETAGLTTTGLREFAAAGELHRFSRLPRKDFNPPSDAIITATLTAWETMPTDTDTARNLWLAIGHELAFGLRAGELGHAKWSWWSTRENYPVIDGACPTKNGTALVQVRALDPWYSTMRARVIANNWNTDPEAYILLGTMTQRTDATFRAVSDWLRKLGWKTQKTNHALRAYAGGQIAMKYMIHEAQCWLRHSTVKVTEQNYSHFCRKFKPLDLATLPARWATIAPAAAPTLRLLEPYALAARN